MAGSAGVVRDGGEVGDCGAGAGGVDECVWGCWCGVRVWVYGGWSCGMEVTRDAADSEAATGEGVAAFE